MTTAVSLCKPIQQQIQAIVKENSNNESLKETMTKISNFASGTIGLNEARKAIFTYIDEGTNGNFSRVVNGSMNLVAKCEYKKYEKLRDNFLEGLKKTSETFNIVDRFNEIVKVVTGKFGVLESADCANFAFL